MQVAIESSTLTLRLMLEGFDFRVEGLGFRVEGFVLRLALDPKSEIQNLARSEEASPDPRS